MQLVGSYTISSHDYNNNILLSNFKSTKINPLQKINNEPM